ncbi:hypothetical protein BJX76DRAFT_215573 [Aspergillus varians]
MDTGYPQSFIQEPGFQNPGVSSTSMPSDYIDPTQQFNPASLYGYVSSSSNGQGISTSPYGEAFSPHGVAPNIDDRSSEYSTVPAMTSSSFGNMGMNMSNPNGTLSTMPTASEIFGDFAQQWSNLMQSPAGPPMAGPVPQHPYYQYATTQSPAPVQTQMFTAPPRFPEIPEVQPRPAQNTFPHGQAMMSTGVPISNSPVSHRQSRNASTFPQSSASSHQRRNQRPTTFGPTPVIPAHHRARSSQSSRGRMRMNPTTTYTDAPPTQQVASQSQISHVSPNPVLNAQSTTRPTERPPTQHPQSFGQGFESEPTVPDWLHHMRPNDVRAIYQTDPPLAPRMDPTFYIQQSAGKRMLDTPQESRPEPKETDELTINMECKICMGQLVDTVLIPCGHAILCRWCADQHIPSSKGFPRGKANCPMCRELVRQKHRIYFP